MGEDLKIKGMQGSEDLEKAVQDQRALGGGVFGGSVPFGEEPHGVLKMDLCVCVKSHSVSLKGALPTLEGETAQEHPLCPPSWPGRETSALLWVPEERSQPRQGLLAFSRARELALHSFVAVAVSGEAVFVKAQVGFEVNVVVLNEKQG